MMFQDFKVKITARVLLVFCPILMSCTSMAKEPAAAVIRKSLSVRGNKEKIWSALTNETELARWWNKGVRLEAYVGGEFYEPWGNGQLATGKVLFVEPPKTIRFTWKEQAWSPEQQTVCEFSFKEGDGFTVLSVEHSGWESFQHSKDQMMESFSKGWDYFLPKLKSYIENEQN